MMIASCWLLESITLYCLSEIHFRPIIELFKYAKLKSLSSVSFLRENSHYSFTLTIQCINLKRHSGCAKTRLMRAVGSTIVLLKSATPVIVMVMHPDSNPGPLHSEIHVHRRQV